MAQRRFSSDIASPAFTFAVPTAAVAAESDSALVPMAHSVEDLMAVRARALAAYPAEDSQAESVLVLLAHPAAD
jgi:hypothetical protein